jgi:osmotically-inducible protein OsmY
MFKELVFPTNPDEFSEYGERNCLQKDAPQGHYSSTQNTDADIERNINHALWKDAILRVLDYHEINVHVVHGIVFLNGHIVNTASQSRIKNAMRSVPGIVEIKNNLVLDDKLIREVAASLAKLEHTYHCKFFTSSSHGVISLNGMVSDEKVKSLAEKCVASNPNVRGVVNHINVSGAKTGLVSQPFMQPAIGESIHFLDGISGVVRQVIINPDNRRVIAMTIQGQFVDQRQERSPNDDEAQQPNQLIVVSMNWVRYLTKVSGFLSIHSHESNRYSNFNHTTFTLPNKGWVPPYPYCPDDVLFSVGSQQIDTITENATRKAFLTRQKEERVFSQELLANDSLGG